MILNPGSTLNNLDYSDYPTAGTLVSSLNNNPAPLS